MKWMKLVGNESTREIEKNRTNQKNNNKKKIISNGKWKKQKQFIIINKQWNK